MNLLEHRAKALLRGAGIMTPPGAVATSPDQAAEIASEFRSVMVKAQVPAGGRGRSGGVLGADTAAEAHEGAVSLLGKQVGPHPVGELLVEERLFVCAAEKR